MLTLRVNQMRSDLEWRTMQLQSEKEKREEQQAQNHQRGAYRQPKVEGGHSQICFRNRLVSYLTARDMPCAGLSFACQMYDLKGESFSKAHNALKDVCAVPHVDLSKPRTKRHEDSVENTVPNEINEDQNTSRT